VFIEGFSAELFPTNGGISMPAEFDDVFVGGGVSLWPLGRIGGSND
jgi:hypothetical protein